MPGAVDGAVVVGFAEDGAADAEGELGDTHSFEVWERVELSVGGGRMVWGWGC